ncbi:hypothetical protein P4H23_11825 [Bacillus cereus]|uniref:Gp46 n=2 Tax=Lwoffvirus TP21 TaxID=57478 RepID=B8R855_9CAUD|nr:hypothetical protein [Bacillus thuringiensis]YP_002333607.1 gp46 [Bacillus phage TP21-L]ANT40065.1 hypothetical protein BMBtpLA3_30 [Bacillus phage BMBtpLA3]MEB8754837.1 hypothetical protein [Bacillus cereus]ACJ70572.1 gp46 [Bacillus phage TP21-L]MEB8790692.1 hypothetical protein [Bacillus cereus]MEB9166333.1 hypothetical protein [Bacillus cereus]
MIKAIKRFICKHWFKRHDWSYVAGVTINGIKEEHYVCLRCGKRSKPLRYKIL